jgi:hypothetical protein
MEKVILIKEIKQVSGKIYFRWAWKESFELNGFGRAASIEEIKKRATKMFPGYELKLLFT